MKVADIATPEQFFVNVNQIVYDGLLFFIMLWLMWIILFMVAQKLKPDQPLPNATYAAASMTVLGFILRAVTAEIDGVTYALISDHQMWVFPIITILLVGIIWATKER